jgi:hypothetical protein
MRAILDLMALYQVRAHDATVLGFVTHSDHYKDYEFETDETMEELAARLAVKGFFDKPHNRWVMPGAIAWIQPVWR